MKEMQDGLEELRQVMSLREVASLIERTARWVSPETFRLLPLWFPEYARRSAQYNGNWSAPRMNRSRATGNSVHKSEGNVYANQALTLALGLTKKLRPNWSCCHIWGVDDASYRLSNVVVMDRRFFSCVGNMVLLPAPLKASRFAATSGALTGTGRRALREHVGSGAKKAIFIFDFHRKIQSL